MQTTTAREHDSTLDSWLAMRRLAHTVSYTTLVTCECSYEYRSGCVYVHALSRCAPSTYRRSTIPIAIEDVMYHSPSVNALVRLRVLLSK